MPDRLVFLSYHKPNRVLAAELARRFAERRARSGLDVEFWFDERLEGGDHWDEVVQNKLHEADIILFLVTTASLNARYMWGSELMVAIDRAAEGARLIPLRHANVHSQIYENIKTKTLHRLPHKPADELGENAWFEAVLDGLFKTLDASLQQRPSVARTFSLALTEARRLTIALAAKLKGMENATFGPVEGLEIISCLTGCRLALAGADPLQIAVDLEGWRRRLAPARVKILPSIHALGHELGELVQAIEAVQTWASEEQPAPALDSLAPRQLLDSKIHADMVSKTRASVDDAGAALDEVYASNTSLTRQLSDQAKPLLEQARLHLDLEHVDVTALQVNVDGFRREERAYSNSAAAQGVPPSDADLALASSADLLRRDAMELVKRANNANDNTVIEAPPHDLGAEEALLGALLFDNEILNRITSRLHAQHFFLPLHGRIFEECGTMIASGMLADGVTLKERFAGDEALRAAGGAVFLMRLMERAATTSADAAYYAEWIVDLALRRQLLNAAREMLDLAQQPPDSMNATDIIEQTERSLFGISEPVYSDRGFFGFRRALTSSIETATLARNDVAPDPCLRTHFSQVDEVLGGLHASDLLLLCSESETDLTAIAAHLALNVAGARMDAQTRDNWRDLADSGGVVGYVSVRASAELIATQILSSATGISITDLRAGRLNASTYGRITDKALELENLPLHFDETPTITLAQITTRARRLKRTAGLDLLIVDNISEIVPIDRFADRVRELEIIAHTLKVLAKDLAIPVLAAWNGAQSNEGAFERVALYADVILDVARSQAGDTEYKATIAKNQHGALGQTSIKLNQARRLNFAPD